MNKRLLDALWLVLLIALVFAIQPTFHGDEAMLTYVTRDFQTAFIERNPAALNVQPPYYIDTDEQLRLLNGSLHRYLSGFVWSLAGATVDQLPPRPGWDWGLDYDTNVATDHYPDATQLAAGRLVSALALAVSIPLIFVLGSQFGGRFTAWFVSGLYAVNPIILLNGRRAMQEGLLLCFGILVMLVAALISRRRAEARPVPFWFWLALSLSGACAIASKHPGVVFVAGAFGWVFVTELLRLRWRDLLLTTAKLLLSGVAVIALFVALSPALWNDPIARFRDLLEQRAWLLDIQVTVDPLAPTTITQRIEGIITQPFMTPPQHFEVASWGNYAAVVADVARYMASPFSGVQFGVLLGGALTLLTFAGVVVSLLELLRRGWRSGVLVWWLVAVASLLVNPLTWQRYFLPLIPVYTLLAGIGFYGVVSRFLPRFFSPSATTAPAA